MKKIILIIVVSLIPSLVFAEEVKITVKGMVCAFCAQGIKKSFRAVESVETVEVDLDKKLVTVATKKDQTLNDQQVKKIIIDAGYDVVSIVRSKT